jgi:hypothetical protein
MRRLVYGLLLLMISVLIGLRQAGLAQDVAPTPTLALWTPTPVPSSFGAPITMLDAGFSVGSGWSCGDFPCENDIEGFLQRIRVSPGFQVEFVGRFPGQVMQIITGGDGRIYATVLENGSLYGAVYAMNADGSTDRYSPTLILPIGLAFQPGTDVLYISARLTPLQGGLLLRLQSDGFMDVVLSDLPCCYLEIGNQPNGLLFGQDGYLYLGVGATTDHSESIDPFARAYDPVNPLEAAILRIHPHTGEVTPYASGIRNPYDIALNSAGQLYATDNGLVTGQGDRILALQPGAFYGWPHYRGRGCEECPPTIGVTFEPDWLPLQDYSLPRGLAAYNGVQFPPNLRDTLFVTLWNGTDYAQRVLWVNPAQVGQAGYVPVTFMTGLIRPVDVVVAPDGTLLVADYIYGHIWRVRYIGGGSSPVGTATATPETTPMLSFLTPVSPIESNTPAATNAAVQPLFFATNTPGG